MTDLNTLIPQARAFYTDLNANNSKAWWGENRGPYDSVLKPGAQAVLADMEPKLSKLTTVPVTSKLFRPHRDVRFSKDKTPYNAHLHMMWSNPGAGKAPAWFFGASPDYMTFGMGVMGLEKDGLTRLRQMIDQDGDDLTDAMQDQGLSLSDWGPEPLKRVPKPYDADHPHADLLKRKSFTVHAPFPPDWQTKGLLPSLTSLVPKALPVWRILDESFPG